MKSTNPPVKPIVAGTTKKIAKINVNDAQLFTQIYNSIKTAKNAFVVGKSV